MRPWRWLIKHEHGMAMQANSDTLAWWLIPLREFNNLSKSGEASIACDPDCEPCRGLNAQRKAASDCAGDSPMAAGAGISGRRKPLGPQNPITLGNLSRQTRREEQTAPSKRAASAASSGLNETKA